LKQHVSNQWCTQKDSEGGAEFRHNRVTSQITFGGSAEDTTVLGGSGDMPPGKFCKFTPIHAFLCILEASFSIMLLRELIAGETENWTFVVWGSWNKPLCVFGCYKF